MNILFVEDEAALSANAVLQLESKGHTVVEAGDIATASRIMYEYNDSIHAVIADQNLPDGEGIEFVANMKIRYPKCMFVIVSGYLGEREMQYLQKYDIPFFRKPLLYAKVLAELRRIKMLSAPPFPVKSPHPAKPEKKEESPLPEIVEPEPVESKLKRLSRAPFGKLIDRIKRK